MIRHSRKKDFKQPASVGQPIVVQKNTTIQGFTSEEKLKHLVERSDWKSVLTCSAFKRSTPGSQAQLVREAINNQIDQLGTFLNYLVNRGPEHCAAMNILQRKQQFVMKS